MTIQIKELLERQVKLVAIAEDFFKKASLTELELDSNILHEYRNCVRAQADILLEVISSQSFTSSTLMLENVATANLAAKCVINDCVDILHTAAKIAGKSFNDKYPYPISSFYSDYYKVTEVIQALDAIIPVTRGEKRRERLEIYIREFTTERAEILHKFLSSIPEIENHMRFKKSEAEKKEQDDNTANASKERQNWKRLLIQLLGASVIAAAGWTMGANASKSQTSNTAIKTESVLLNPKTP
jgi:hypothetical protein